VSLSLASRTRYAGLAGLTLALLGAPAMITPARATPAPAQALPTSGPVCIAATDHDAPARHVVHDTTPMSAATVAAVDDEVTSSSLTASRRSTGSAARAAVLPVLNVNVQIHIIRGRHKHEHRVKWRGAAQLFRILRDGFNGAQSPGVSEPMGVNFALKRISVTRNDRWYHAYPMSRADRQMRRHLHRGTAQTLNIYIKTFPRVRGGLLLGHSRFPWQYRGHRAFDGVEVNVDAMPNGGARQFNLGDTVIHESGHWFGLLHTFQNGCDPTNDGVADTPAEIDTAHACGDIANLCDPTQVQPAPAGPGYYDPAFNFMEYTPDACMRMFTAGQHERAVTMFTHYRYGRR
jgi:hypothetical protein